MGMGSLGEDLLGLASVEEVGADQLAEGDRGQEEAVVSLPLGCGGDAVPLAPNGSADVPLGRASGRWTTRCGPDRGSTVAGRAGAVQELAEPVGQGDGWVVVDDPVLTGGGSGRWGDHVPTGGSGVDVGPDPAGRVAELPVLRGQVVEVSATGRCPDGPGGRQVLAVVRGLRAPATFRRRGGRNRVRTGRGRAGPDPVARSDQQGRALCRAAVHRADVRCAAARTRLRASRRRVPRGEPGCARAASAGRW